MTRAESVCVRVCACVCVCVRACVRGSLLNRKDTANAHCDDMPADERLERCVCVCVCVVLLHRKKTL